MKQKTEVDYDCTEKYKYFLKKGGDHYRDMIKKMNVDECCEDMFDAEIDAKTDLMKIDAAEQYTSNLKMHQNKRRNQEADLVLKQSELQRLNAKLKCIENEIAHYRALKLEKVYEEGDNE